jgi:mannose/fructose-specific phosphotransferase system component IIA
VAGVVGIVVAHGDLAECLVETARLIYGTFERCYAVTNRGKSPGVLVKELERLLDRHRGEPVLVLVDFFGGSCCHACLAVQERRRELKIVSGVNLPMLLSFLNKRDQVPFEELPELLVDRGRRSLRVVDIEE